jgi:hypothetical protein
MSFYLVVGFIIIVMGIAISISGKAAESYKDDGNPRF